MKNVNASDYFKTGGNTVANLVGIVPDGDGATYDAISFFNNWVVATSTPRSGGKYVFDKNRAKSDHNGDSVISPTVPWDGEQATLTAFEAGTGETDVFGFGCWVAVNPAALAGVGGGSAVSVLTVSRNLTDADNNATLVYSGGSDIVLTVPSGLASGFSATVIQAGGGLVSFLQGGGVGFDNVGGTRGQGTFATIVQVSADQYGFQNPVPSAPVTFLQTSIPFIFPSSWSFAANGALTLSVALPTTFPAAFVYFPLDAIGSGVPAGWYYTTFASTTAGTVFNNRYLSGTPEIPSSPTAFVTAPGSVAVQTTTAINGIQATLPGGSMGRNGVVRVEALWQSNNSAQVKAVAAQLGTSNIAATSMSTTNVMAEIDAKMHNTGVTNRQSNRSATINSTTGTPSYTTVDTTTDQLFAMTHTLGTPATGDYSICIRMSASVQFRG